MGKLAKEYNRKEFNTLLDELDKLYDITPLTVYQWRFNNKIDIYPSSCKFFDLEKKQWGEYQANNLLKKFLNEKLSNENT